METDKMNVLSLFDGISCGQLAFQRLGIPVNYYASEIDKNAMRVTATHFRDTMNLGDVEGYQHWGIPQVDIVMGGSPCQGFSFGGKELNFSDPRSKLFFTFVECLKLYKPKYFLLENVMMQKKFSQVITDYLGVEPIAINSKLISAQNRVRLYWTNIPNVTQPEDKRIFFSDKIEGFPARMVGRRLGADGKRKDYETSISLKQYIECRSDFKSNCITTVSKDCMRADNWVKRVPVSEVGYYYLTPQELEWLQTLPEDYTACLPRYKRIEVIGNAWTVDVITHILQGLKDEFQS
jgi:site-specific DNA-cytosine methylase